MGQIGGIYFKDDEEDKKKKTPSQVAREQNNADRGQIGSIRYSSTYKPVYAQEPQVALQQPVQEVEPVEQESKLKTSVDKTFDVIGNIFKAIGKGELNKAATINSATQKSIKKQGDLLASPYDKSALEQREYQVIKQGVLKSSSKVETQAEVLKRKQDNPIEYLINRPYAKTDEGYLRGDIDKTPMEVMNERLKTASEFYNSLSAEDKVRIKAPDYVDEETYYNVSIYADDTIGKLNNEIELINKQLEIGGSNKQIRQLENRKEELEEYVAGLKDIKQGIYTQRKAIDGVIDFFTSKESIPFIGAFLSAEESITLLRAYKKLEKGEELSEREKMLVERDDIGDTIDYLTNEYTLGSEIAKGTLGSVALMAEFVLAGILFKALGLGVEGISVGANATSKFARGAGALATGVLRTTGKAAQVTVTAGMGRIIGEATERQTPVYQYYWETGERVKTKEGEDPAEAWTKAVALEFGNNLVEVGLGGFTEPAKISSNLMKQGALGSFPEEFTEEIIQKIWEEAGINNKRFVLPMNYTDSENEFTFTPRELVTIGATTLLLGTLSSALDSGQITEQQAQQTIDEQVQPKLQEIYDKADGRTEEEFKEQLEQEKEENPVDGTDYEGVIEEVGTGQSDRFDELEADIAKAEEKIATEETEVEGGLIWEYGAEDMAAVPNEPVAFLLEYKGQDLADAKATISFDVDNETQADLGYKITLQDGTTVSNPQASEIGGSPYFETRQEAETYAEKIISEQIETVKQQPKAKETPVKIEARKVEVDEKVINSKKIGFPAGLWLGHRKLTPLEFLDYAVKNRDLYISEEQKSILKAIMEGKGSGLVSADQMPKEIKMENSEGGGRITLTPEQADYFLKQRELLAQPKTQKEVVKETLKEREAKSIKQIAEETKIKEPNIRRILGVGTKEGEFERVAEGVYVLKTAKGQVAYIETGNALESLPRLARDGFKADMVFLDIPYDTPAVKGGNRGMKYGFITPDEFGYVLDSVNKILSSKDSAVIYMFSQAKSGWKKMQEYNKMLDEKGLKVIAKGEWQKRFKNGKKVTNVRGELAEPEGILLLSQSGKLNKDIAPIDLNFDFVRPKGYQSEKNAEMIKDMIELTTGQGDIVLDPFAGSGVVPAEAIKAGRSAVAIEVDKKVVEETIKPRVEKASKEVKKVSMEDVRKEALEYPSANNFAYIANRMYGMSLEQATETWNEMNKQKAVHISEATTWISDEKKLEFLNNSAQDEYGKTWDKLTPKQQLDTLMKYMVDGARYIKTTDQDTLVKIGKGVGIMSSKDFTERNIDVLLYKGLEEKMYTDGMVLVTDSKVANELNKKFIQQYVKAAAKTWKVSEQEANKRIKEGVKDKEFPATKDLLDSAKANHKLTPIGFYTDGSIRQSGSIIFRADNGTLVRLSGKYYSAIKSFYPTAEFYITDESNVKPISFVVGKTRKGIVMPMVMPTDSSFDNLTGTTKLTAKEQDNINTATVMNDADVKGDIKDEFFAEIVYEKKAIKDIPFREGVISHGAGKYKFDKYGITVDMADGREYFFMISDIYDEITKQVKEEDRRSKLTDEERKKVEEDDLPFRKEGRKRLNSDKLNNMQLSEMKRLSREIFGDEKVEIMEQVLTPDTLKWMGRYINEMIQIRSGSVDKGSTFYHEVVHKALDIFLTPQEKALLIKEVRRLKGDEYLKKEFGKLTAKDQKRIGKYRDISKAEAILSQYDDIQERVGAGIEKIVKANPTLKGKEGRIQDLADVLNIESSELSGAVLKDTRDNKVVYQLIPVDYVGVTHALVQEDTLQDENTKYFEIVKLPEVINNENFYALNIKLFNPKTFPYSSAKDAREYQKAFRRDPAVQSNFIDYRKQDAKEFTEGMVKYRGVEEADLDAMAEEWLAENILDHINTKTPTTFIGKIKRMIEQFMDRWFGVMDNINDITDFYEGLLSGRLLARQRKLDSQRAKTFDKYLKSIQGAGTKTDAVYRMEVAKEVKKLTTKILKKLEGKTLVKKQFISDLTKQQDIKQVEKDIINSVLKTFPDEIDVATFGEKVLAQLLPLERETLSSGKYPMVTVPSSTDSLGYSDWDYSENIYTSPIEVKAGLQHFGFSMGDVFEAEDQEMLKRDEDIVDRYFGHTRVENSKDIRRVLEVQSDLYQKGQLGEERNIVNRYPTSTKQLSLLKGIEQLESQYKNPTAHLRMVREEVRQASLDNVKTLLFPTGKTSAYIEGFLKPDRWKNTKGEIIHNVKGLKYGDIITDSQTNNEWIVLSVNDNGMQNRIFAKPMSSVLTKDSKDLELSSGGVLDTIIKSFGFDFYMKGKKLIPKDSEEIVKYIRSKGGKVSAELFIELLRRDASTAYKTVGLANDYTGDPLALNAVIKKEGFDGNDLIDIADIHKDFTWSGEAFYIGETQNYEKVLRNPELKATVDFYEKDLGKYLKNNYEAKEFVDEDGYTWWKVDIKPEYAGAVEAFRLDELVDYGKVAKNINKFDRAELYRKSRQYLEDITKGKAELIGLMSTYKTKQEFLDSMLFHGSSEGAFDGKFTGGGYDGVFIWTTDSPKTAQNYIPSVGGKSFFSFRANLDDVINPSRFNNDKALQELFGLKFEDIKWDSSGRYAESWRNLNPVTEREAMDKLKKLGYTFDKWGGIEQGLIEVDGKIQKPDYKETSELYIFSGKKNLNLKDIRVAEEGDLMDVDYNKFDEFKKAKDEGYDGVIINDFGQSDLMGNYNHTSFGLFEKGYKKLQQIKVPAQNFDEWDTYKGELTPELDALWSEAHKDTAKYRLEDEDVSVKLPELVSLAENLGANVKLQASFRKAGTGGDFKPQGGTDSRIRILRTLFEPQGEEVTNADGETERLPETPEQQMDRIKSIEKVLGHEIGHLFDWFGGVDNMTLKRGNILGRIGNFRSFLGGTLMSPEQQSEYEEAKRYAKDLQYERKQVKGSDKNKYEDLGKQLKITNKRIKELEEDALAKHPVVRKELKTMTQVWNPFEESQVPEEYLKYRYSSKELYAEALSVLFNDPSLLKQTAPTFYQSFVEYLASKKEVKAEFFAIKDSIKESTYIEKRIDKMDEGFEKGRGARMSAVERKEVGKKQREWENVISRVKFSIADQHAPYLDKVRKIYKEGGIELSRLQESEMLMDEMEFIGDKQGIYAKDIQANFFDPISEAGISVDDLGKIMVLERDLGDRKDLANPQGLVYDYAKETYDELKRKFTPAEWVVLQDRINWFREYNFNLVQEGYKAGVYSKQFFEEIALVNKNTYTPFAVIEYINDNYVTAGIIQAKGTLKQVENPINTQMLKSLELIRLTATNLAKTDIIKTLQEFAPDEVVQAQAVRGEDGYIKMFKRDPELVDKGYEQLELLIDGKRVAFYIDGYIKESFDKLLDMSTSQAVKFFFAPVRAFNRIFKPAVTTFKPSFQFYSNPIKDVKDSLNNLSALSAYFDQDNRGVALRTGRVYKAFMKEWISSLKQSWDYAGDKMDKVTDQMLRVHAISGNIKYEDIDLGTDEISFDAVKNRVVHKGKVNWADTAIEWSGSKAILKQTIYPLLKIYQRLGQTLEVNSKIAGFQYFTKEVGLDERTAGYYTRKYVGTPNFMQKGKFTNITNEIQPFSNVAMQGFSRSIELAGSPKTASGYWFSMFFSTIVPKLVMLAGATLLKVPIPDPDDEDKTIWVNPFDYMSEYDKSNYITIPIGYDITTKKWLYLRIPMSETEQVVGNAVWKMGRVLQGEGIKVEQLAVSVIGMIPFAGLIFGDGNPFTEIVGGWADYAQGRNPYDDFRGRPAISTSKWEQAGAVRFNEMLKWTSNTIGLTNFTTYDKDLDTTLEHILQAPILERMFRLSDYGLTEREEWEKSMGKRTKNKTLDSYLEKYYSQPSDKNLLKYQQEYVVAVKGKAPEGGWSGTEKAEETRLKSEFKREVLANSGNGLYTSIAKTGLSNDEKKDIIDVKTRKMSDGQKADYLSQVVKYEIVKGEMFAQYAKDKGLSSDVVYKVVKASIPVLSADSNNDLLRELRQAGVLSDRSLTQLRNDGLITTVGYRKYLGIKVEGQEEEQTGRIKRPERQYF